MHRFYFEKTTTRMKCSFVRLSVRCHPKLLHPQKEKCCDNRLHARRTNSPIGCDSEEYLILKITILAWPVRMTVICRIMSPSHFDVRTDPISEGTRWNLGQTVEGVMSWNCLVILNASRLYFGQMDEQINRSAWCCSKYGISLMPNWFIYWQRLSPRLEDYLGISKYSALCLFRFICSIRMDVNIFVVDKIKLLVERRIERLHLSPTLHNLDLQRFLVRFISQQRRWVSLGTWDSQGHHEMVIYELCHLSYVGQSTALRKYFGNSSNEFKISQQYLMNYTLKCSLCWVWFILSLVIPILFLELNSCSYFHPHRAIIQYLWVILQTRVNYWKCCYDSIMINYDDMLMRMSGRTT